MSLPLAAASAAAGLATAAYLDARFHFRHDIKRGSNAAAVQESIEFITESYKKNKMLIYHVLEERASGTEAENIFLIYEGKSWTYKQFFSDMQRVGNWLLNDLEIQPGEVVALDGENSPEYLLLWFAIEGLGACVGFINSNLTSSSLVHCVKLCEARYILADVNSKHLVQPCEEEFKALNIKTVYYSAELVSTLKDTTPLPEARRKGILPDALGALIYTSGTTGMPKGTIISRGREINLLRAISKYLELKPGDRMYTALPLYHGAAHGLCVTPVIGAGATVVLSRKFSHKTFWPEVRASNANIVQYVGELCRYLVNAPPSPLDKQHNVKSAWGNGMRPDVWEAFRQRFGIETIHELYAATDGLGPTFNANRGDFSRNAISVRGLYWQWQNGNNEKRVRIDIDTQEILRDPKTGFATECSVDEPGEVIHRLDPAAPDASFTGYYRNKAAGDKRKIKDIFQKGDLWFRSGDMMRQDREGRVYFVDRLGDTFRWKSENVSTNEVSDVVGEFAQIAETNVYGVLVPHADGRCGCAAIVPVQGVSESNFDFAGLANHVIRNLPRYAVPVFIRVVKEMEYTGTMKMQKGRLRSEGVDLDQISKSAKDKGEPKVDAMYWLPPGKKENVYVPFTEKDWLELKGGRVRL